MLGREVKGSELFPLGGRWTGAVVSGLLSSKRVVALRPGVCPRLARFAVYWINCQVGSGVVCSSTVALFRSTPIDQCYRHFSQRNMVCCICAKILLLLGLGHLSSIQCRFAERRYGISFKCLNSYTLYGLSATSVCKVGLTAAPALYYVGEARQRIYCDAGAGPEA